MLQQLTKKKMKKTNLLTPMLMIFLLCLIFTSTLLVQGMALVADDPDDPDDAREVKIDVSKDVAIIKSESEESKNEFKIVASTSDEGIEIKLEYRDKTDADEADLEFKVNFYELIEYIDVNLDGVYNNASDDLIRTVPLNDFEPIDYSPDTDEDDTPIHIITINTTETDGVFMCQIYAAGEFATIDGSVVTPTEIKITFGIHNFEYHDEDSDLALNIRLESPGESEIVAETVDEANDLVSDEVGVDVSLDGFAGFFSWSEKATVNGAEVDVKYSLYDEDVGDGTDLKICLNYPCGEEIIHDPKIGVLLSTASTPSEIVSNLLSILELSKEGYLASVAAITLLVMSVFVLHRRKGR